MREKPTNKQIINSVYELCMVAPTCFGITLPSSGSVDGCVVSSDIVRTAHHITRNNTSIHNILSTAPQLSISQKALRTLPEGGNVMPKHVEATIHN
jgi:hypothetical protein